MTDRYPSFDPRRVAPADRGTPRRSATPPTPPQAPPPPPSTSTSLWLVIGVILAGIGVGLAIVYFVLPRWLGGNTDAPATTPVAAPAAASDARKQSMTLYYVSDDGTALVPVTTDVTGATPADQMRALLTAQLAPAPPNQVSAIPAGVTLRNVFVTTAGDAYIDVSREIITGHPGGSLNEALTVYTLVNALTTNFHITSVQVLVDGKPIDTLAGHLDLRQPLAAGTRWIQKGP